MTFHTHHNEFFVGISLAYWEPVLTRAERSAWTLTFGLGFVSFAIDWDRNAGR